MKFKQIETVRVTWCSEHIAYVINSCKNFIHKIGRNYVALGKHG